MGEFVDAVRGITDASLAVTLRDHPEATLPIISGNVSLYNESAQGAIPPSPMIGCLGSMPDVAKVITYDFKRSDSFIVMIGERKDECGGSVYYQLQNELGSNVPKPDLASLSREIHAVHAAIQNGLVLAAHDISEGGVAVAVAEMCFKRQPGVKITVPGDLSTEKKLFGETGGFILEVAREKLMELKKIFAAQSVAVIPLGETTTTSRLQMNGVIDLPVSDAKSAWENGLRERLL
jgi:phosphoribosylformylglycinamidine synthase